MHSGPTVRVLIIDHLEEDRRYYANALTLISSDYEVLEADNGQSGLDLYKSSSIDCVILELSLPDMSGFDVLEKIVPDPTQPEVPVIILTEQRLESLLEVAITHGVKDVLLKATTSGDSLDQFILKSIIDIRRDRQRAQPAVAPHIQSDQEKIA